MFIYPQRRKWDLISCAFVNISFVDAGNLAHDNFLFGRWTCSSEWYREVYNFLAFPSTYFLRACACFSRGISKTSLPCRYRRFQ